MKFKQEGPSENPSEKPPFEKHWSLATDVSLVAIVQSVVRENMQRQGWHTDEVEAMDLAFLEALTNAVRHGNKFDRNKKVAVAVKISPKSIYLKVCDEGKGFKFEEVPNPLAEENKLKTSGRGVMIMKNAFDVSYEDNGSIIILKKEKE
jgi:serine/threonine-protein kinase RsbW